MPNLRHRDRQPEWMDDPNLDPALHCAALEGLARINRFSGSAGALWPTIASVAKQLNRPLKLLDVATGSGDVVISILRRATRAGIAIEASACDLNPVAVGEAQKAASGAGVKLDCFQANAVNGGLPTGFDIVTCSLFLHHLDDADAITLLRNMATSGQVVLVNDLSRSWLNYWLVWGASHVLSRSPVVRMDGPLSVRAAFTRTEVRALAEAAGLAGATVRPRFPCRMLLTWQKP
jgi:2-polyprenyl-3-methyl-5-hydroxy-6-metoxy-1,4-benzoquinol methylase